MGNPGFKEIYGNWAAVLVAFAIFSAFLLGFSRPRGKRDFWAAGIYEAFLISLFTEMFGIPLTIYIISSLLKVSPFSFGLHESHLFAYLLSLSGLISLGRAVELVMAISGIAIIGALVLLAAGWVKIYRSRGALVTTGIYSFMRHPQYLGLVIIVLAFNLQWPTILTLTMSPILMVMYSKLAKKEEKELVAIFGEAYTSYVRKVPPFLPIRLLAPFAKSS